jgi:hypothetical protein
MATEIKRKPVAFNVADPDQRKLYEHCMQRTNFSYYIKTLILRDLEAPQLIKTITEGTIIQNNDEEKIDISSFI